MTHPKFRNFALENRKFKLVSPGGLYVSHLSKHSKILRDFKHLSEMFSINAEVPKDLEKPAQIIGYLQDVRN